jgi:hypothetical protein
MVRKLVIAAAVSVAVLGSAARADPLLASNPQTFMDFFVAEGVSAQLTVDVAGDPLIEFLHEGEKKLLFFYDCVENRDCLAVQFFAGFKLDGPVSLEKLNDWNSGERRFTRAYRMCSVPDDRIDPRRSALFMARSVLREIRDGGTDACSTA